jgi:hypothetical protein
MPVPVWNSYQTLPSLVSVGSCEPTSPVSAQKPLLLAALEDALLDEALEEALLDELLDLDEDTELAALEELPVAVGPTEHHALAVKLFAGNSEVWQVKLPVNVAYTNDPDLPSATVCVPVIVHALPTCAHFVYPLGLSVAAKAVLARPKAQAPANRPSLIVCLLWFDIFCICGLSIDMIGPVLSMLRMPRGVYAAQGMVS